MIEPMRGPDKFQIGSIHWSRYRIDSVISLSYFSREYLVMDLRSGLQRVLKVIPRLAKEESAFGARKRLADPDSYLSLVHPCLPAIVEVIDDGDDVVLIRNIIRGVNLGRKVEAEGPQAWQHVIRWGKELCDVMIYLHSQQPPILHLDLKPERILLGQDNSVTWLDIEPIRWVKTAERTDCEIYGCIYHIAPEAFCPFYDCDVRSDVYGLGAVLFHLVTGKLPCSPEVLYTMPPVRSLCPWLPRSGREGKVVRHLEQIIEKCVRKNPKERYQDCTELKKDLCSALALAEGKKTRSGILGKLLERKK